ncbi:MAG: flagellar M-ring protein FliF [Oscillospiraceae bacterium]|nr:flagellar M-ring protein FliF [Oscillospiraceae bacterium]
MQELIRKLRDKLTEWWDKTEKRDRVRFFIITGAALLVIIIAATLLSRTEYTVLFRDMDAAEAGEVAAYLRDNGVKYRSEGSGTILVPVSQADSLKMELATQGYPKTGYPYELLSRGAGFGTTESEKKLYERLDLQERLATTLRQFAPHLIQDAHVEIAKQDASSVLLSSQVMPTTASVMLTLVSADLSADNIAAVENLVASSVEGLEPENVYITDQYLRRLNNSEQDSLSSVETDYEKTAAVRNDMVQSIMHLLGAIYGTDNVRVSGQVTLDFDERATDSVIFTPVVDDQGIDISLREVIEQAKGSTGATGEPGIDENGAAPIYVEGTDNSVSDYSSITREINREVNETRESVVHAQGTISDLSFAIAVNSDNLSSENESADAVRNLVAGVVGLDEREASRISVEFRPFDGVRASQNAQQQLAAAQSQNQWMEFFKVFGLYLLIGICLLVILRRLLKLFGTQKRGKNEQLAMEMIEGADASGEAAELTEYDNLTKLATQVGGEEITISKSVSRERVEEFIDKNPEAVANLLRNWLSEEVKSRRAKA